MHSSILLPAFFAVAALSSPLLKRDLVTEVVVVTVTNYVYADAPTAAPAAPAAPVEKPPAEFYQSYYHHSHAASSVAPVAPTPSSSSVVVEVPSSTPAAPAPPPPASTSAPAPAPAPVSTSTSTPLPAPVTSAPAASSFAAAPSNDLPRTFVSGLDPESSTYSGLVVLHHNVHRSNHSASDLTWNTTLAGYARTKAQGCVWDESQPGPGGYGMNIAQGVPIGNISVVVTEQWYNGEIGYYPGYGIDDLDTSESSNFAKWGHFSQLVWKASQSVGCYTQSACGANNGAPPGDYTVCMYYPPGNFLGDFTQVGAPLGRPKVYVNADGTQGL